MVVWHAHLACEQDPDNRVGTLLAWQAFFKNPINAEVVKKSFKIMEQCMIRYDVDHSSTLQLTELNAFFGDHFKKLYQSGMVSSIMKAVHPNLFQDAQYGLKFAHFMHLIYLVLTKMPGNTLKGKYAKLEAFSSYDGRLWSQLQEAFKVLEHDFIRFDADGDRCVDYQEITKCVPASRAGYDRLDVLSRLQYHFQQVDIDGDRTLDFYEFCYLGFMMTQDGAYGDMVNFSTNAKAVKKTFIDIHSFYRKYDEDGNLRLTYDEVEKFAQDLFGQIPANMAACFQRVAYKSSTTQGRDAVDIVRFMKMLYMMTCPNGEFHPDRYSVEKKKTAPQVITIAKAQAPARPPRFQNVMPNKFVKEKLLGQGGQGTVHLGTYEGQKVAGKTLLGTVDEQTVAETKEEIRFFLKLNHPNVHYLLGAKTTLENGGIMLLTEVCENGSLFDVYSKMGCKFDNATAWRIAKECATGFKMIHEINFMHRDIKSLNVFMGKNMIAKVADFGMCTDAIPSTDVCGTPQWMAPEVLGNMFGREIHYDGRCDVYSYGILLWEIFHCNIPYAETGMDQMQIADAVLNSNIRPSVSRSCPQPVQGIIMQCWAKSPDQRPSFSEVVDKLNACASSCGTTS
jgi:Ca2+-binding EF-hand superfamily protein